MKLLSKKKNKKEKNKVNIPSWYKIYEQEDIPKHIEYPDISLYDTIEMTAKKYPEYTAYSYYGKTSSYHKFMVDIAKCAKAFKASGIKKGDIITICMPNTPEAIIAFYAINKIGAIANMIHPLSSENEIKHYLEDTNSIVLVAVDMVWSKLKNILDETAVRMTILVSVSVSMNSFMSIGYWLTKGRKFKKIKNGPNIIYWKDFIALSRRWPDQTNVHAKSNDPAVILHSGGTTGKSKGVLLSNLNINSLAAQELVVCKKLDLGVSVLSVMPIFHGFGLASCIHTVFCVGGISILLPQFQAKKFGELLNKYKPNIIAAVPTIYEGIISSKALEKKDLSYLKCCLSGGDSLNATLKHKVDEFLKAHNADTTVRTAYGMTECVSGVTMLPIDGYRDDSIGIPCPDSYIKIVKPNTHDEVPVGEDGEICINGPSVMMEYINDPIETHHALQVHEDGKLWLHSGDLGSIDTDGFVYFRQRIKRMIVSSGYNIYPSQIESVISQHPDVLTCTVIGVDHPYKVQVAKAFIVLKEGVELNSSVKKSIKEHCEKNIVAYAMPYEFEYRDSLPTTLVGKVAFTKLMDEDKQKKKIEEK